MSQTTEEKFEIDKGLKRRTILSILSLFFQSGYSSILGFTANLVLSIVLLPKIFGIYITILSLISFLNYFSDIGLAASLIQKKEVDETDKKTVFTIQQILILTLIIIGFLFTNTIQTFYKLQIDGVYLYWSLLIAFYISSLKTIPSIMLEKALKFNKIAFVQIIENTFFYVSVIIFGLLKFGLYSFTISVLLRAVVGLILMYSISFWKPGISISFYRLKQLLSFGLSFQTSSLLALFKDDFMILFLSKILGFEAIGYIGWAKKWAEAPIRIIMDNLSKVLFPLLSKLQSEKKHLANVINKMLYYQTLLIAPTISGLVLIMGNLVILIPKYQKWESAMPLFYLFAISSLFLTYSSPFINLFYALGKAKVALFFMIFWTIITWVMVPILIGLFGPLGYPMVHVLIALSFILVLIQAKKYININFIKSITPGLFSSGLMFVIILMLNQYLEVTWINLILKVIIGIIIYFTSINLIFKIDPIAEIQEFKKNLK